MSLGTAGFCRGVGPTGCASLMCCACAGRARSQAARQQRAWSCRGTLDGYEGAAASLALAGLLHRAAQLSASFCFEQMLRRHGCPCIHHPTFWENEISLLT